jgi:transposase-like protein
VAEITEAGLCNGKTSDPATYLGYRFPAEIISHAVWLYHVVSLSLKDVEVVLAERNITVTRELLRGAASEQPAPEQPGDQLAQTHPAARAADAAL